MVWQKEQRINEAIDFLKSNGYKVKKNYDYLIGKWVAFRQEGMDCILHGKVTDISDDVYCIVKCKNRYKRFVNVKDIIEFCNNKEDCYIIE